MFDTRISIFDTNDTEVSFALNVRREGLRTRVYVDWSNLEVKYIGDKDVTILGVKAHEGFTVGYADELVSTPSTILFASNKTHYWYTSFFTKDCYTNVLYNSTHLFIANGVISIEARFDGVYTEYKTVTLPILDQSLYRQHGDTESWGSYNKKDLFFPWQNVRL